MPVRASGKVCLRFLDVSECVGEPVDAQHPKQYHAERRHGDRENGRTLHRLLIWNSCSSRLARGALHPTGIPASSSALLHGRTSRTGSAR